MDIQLMQDIRLLIMVISVFLGLSLGLFLSLNESAKNKANTYLGILVLCITLFFLPHFFARFRLLETFHFVIGLPRIIPFLFGPLTLMYVRACTQKGFIMKRVDWLHFIPALIMLINCWPELTMDVAEKITNQRNFAKTGTVSDYAWIWLLKVIHPLIYFGLSIQLILRYRQHVTNAASHMDSAFHRWVLTFIFILSLPILGLLLFVFTEFGRFSLVILSIGLMSFLIAIYIATLVKPELFHAFPYQMPIPTSTETKKQKYENSNLKEAQKEQYLQKLEAFMHQHKPFQEPELTLAQLSEKVKIPAHYLSQVINEKLQINFLDFINGYRVKEAQVKLIDPSLSHYTILSIAYESGFNSKSTFYAAFKRATGMTPSQFRKSSFQ